MLMQIAPRHTRPRNPENPIENKTMVPRATTTARAALDHKWFKAGPFLVAHQTPDHDCLPKSYRESETTPVGNPLCQHFLDFCLVRVVAKLLHSPCMIFRGIGRTFIRDVSGQVLGFD